VTGVPYHRPRTEVVRDVLAACRRLGELGLFAELAMSEPDISALETTSAGLQRALAEYRATGGDHVD
jgi:hypothetical protein